jgi:hypothetical protein
MPRGSNVREIADNNFRFVVTVGIDFILMP